MLKKSQRHPNIPPIFQYTPLYPDHPKVQNKFGIEDDNDIEKLRKTKADGLFENTLQH